MLCVKKYLDELLIKSVNFMKLEDCVKLSSESPRIMVSLRISDIELPFFIQGTLASIDQHA